MNLMAPFGKPGAFAKNGGNAGPGGLRRTA